MSSATDTYPRCGDCTRILGGREGPDICDACADDRHDLAEAAYFHDVDDQYLAAALRSDIEGAVCVFCPALTSAPDGLCGHCRDGWGMNERPAQRRHVPNRDTNHGAPGDLA